MSDQAWHDWRAQGIGGSDVSKILGISTHGTAYTVWLDKVGISHHKPYSDRQWIGIDLEPYLAASFARRTGLTIINQQAWRVQPGHPHRRCTLDGEVSEGDDQPIATWQAKTWHEFKPWGTWDNVPPAILAQMIWEMGVAGLYSSWLTVQYAGFQLEHLHVPFNRDMWDYMTDVVDRFWTEHVLTGIAPDATGGQAEADAIRDAYPQSEPRLVEIDPELHTAWCEARDARLTLEKEEKALANRIKAAMGTADTATIAGIPVLTWTTTEADEIDPRAERMPKPRKAAVEIPERARKFYNPEPTRTLRPIKTKDAA